MSLIKDGLKLFISFHRVRAEWRPVAHGASDWSKRSSGHHCGWRWWRRSTSQPHLPRQPRESAVFRRWVGGARSLCSTSQTDIALQSLFFVNFIDSRHFDLKGFSYTKTHHNTPRLYFTPLFISLPCSAFVVISEWFWHFNSLPLFMIHSSDLQLQLVYLGSLSLGYLKDNIFQSRSAPLLPAAVSLHLISSNSFFSAQRISCFRRWVDGTISQLNPHTYLAPQSLS